MSRVIAFAVGLCLLLPLTASAHRIDEYLQATMLSLAAHRVQGSMRLIPGVLVAPAVIAAIDSNGDGVFSEDEKRNYAERVLGDLSLAIDGNPARAHLVAWDIPQPAQLRDGLGEIHINYAADLPGSGANHSLILTNHHLAPRSVYLVNTEVPEDASLLITAQKRNPQQTMYELDYQQAGAPANRSLRAGMRARFSGVQVGSLFRLGIRHIAEGTDHLLFLLTLLLPAPLLAAHGRWGGPVSVRRSLVRVLSIVTAFTIGHSITLTLAALGTVRVPGRPVELLIAVSIFISAMHALRPLVPGREVWIAGFFGLIHGLAFAATLDRLGLGRWERVGGILAFNVGIEAMQMIVVLALLPSLLLLSRTRAYTPFRVMGALFAGIASLGWMVERGFGLHTPVDQVVNAFAHHAVGIAGLLLLASLVCRGALGSNAPRVSTAEAI